MEQGLSFIGVVALIMVGVLINSPLWTLIAFVLGVGYLHFRGRKKGWEWRRD